MDMKTQKAVAAKACMEEGGELSMPERARASPACPMCRRPLHASINEFGVQDWHCHSCGIRSRY